MPNSLQNQYPLAWEIKQTISRWLCRFNEESMFASWWLLVYFVNILQLKSLQATLNDAFELYRDNISRADELLDCDSVELQEIYGLYEAQEVRKSLCDSKIEKSTIDAASHFNKQVTEELTRDKSDSKVVGLQDWAHPAQGSIKRRSQRKKATLLEKQGAQKRTKEMETWVKLLELEMKQKQFEFQHHFEFFFCYYYCFV